MSLGTFAATVVAYLVGYHFGRQDGWLAGAGSVCRGAAEEMARRVG